MDTGTKNQLAGAWQRMTGRTQMAAGAQFDDPELFFNGVVDAMQGQLQQKIGADQANRVRGCAAPALGGHDAGDEGQDSQAMGGVGGRPGGDGRGRDRSGPGQAEAVRGSDRPARLLRS